MEEDQRGEPRRSVDATASRDKKKRSATEAINLLPKLFDACRWGDGESAEKIGHEIVEAISSTHGQVAERIKKRLGTTLRPKRISMPDELLESRVPRHGLDAVILPAAVESECRAIIQEHERANELARFKLLPRHKVLLYGPPGNGKTMLAEGIAKELDVPFMPVKYGGLIESFLGQTGKNLQRIFDYAESGPCVIFMDEFDGVAIDRSDAQDTGEIRRVTNQLLILIERLPATCMFIAATNAEKLLDRAVMRRFDFALEIPSPTMELRVRTATRELAPALTPGYDLSHHAMTVAQMKLPNLSDVVRLCERIRRDLVLNEGAGVAGLLSA